MSPDTRDRGLAVGLRRGRLVHCSFNVASSSSNGPALRWRWLLPVVVAVAVIHLTPLGAMLDRLLFDAAMRRPLRSEVPPDGSALVMLDNHTLDALSAQGFGTRWPPPRATFAALIAGLERAGAKRIVLDFIFLEHAEAVEQDLLLGGLAAGLPNVVLARTPKQMPAFWDEAFVSAHKSLFAAPHVGVVEATPDRDGVLRRYNVPGSLAAAAFGNFSTSRGGLLRWYGGLEKIRGADGRVPVISAARFIIAGLPMITRLAESAPDATPEALATALHAEAPLQGPGFDDVRGRIVFVGANAEGTFDQKPFAIGGLEPGVLAHWTAWSNLTGNGFIRELPLWIAPAIAALVIAGLAWIGAKRSGLLVPVSFAVVAAVAMMVASYVGLSFGWFLPPATPVAAAGFALLGVVAENFWTERRRRHEVQAVFGSYVAPEIVELLVRDPNAIRLGGERREATVFFCDLAGFTDLSEKVSPEELLELINGYLQETSDCLMAHGAYIDKYIGDAVMAVFGAPKTLPNHALAACRAALATQQLLTERNKRLAVSHGRTLGLRIGINTGEMIVGNLGSERKKNYTVIGDAVNLASRLEGANKEFGTSILISEETARRVRDQLTVRPLTALRVKGKKLAIPVSELVGEAGLIPPATVAFLQAYTAGHELYTSRRFAEAVSSLERAANLAPADRMTQKLLVDSRRLAIDPPPADWQPILSLETK